MNNLSRRKHFATLATIALALCSAGIAPGRGKAQEQTADLDWRPSVARPAYPAAEGPRIVLDAAHGSRQTIDDRYAGFAALMRADGYLVEPGHRAFDASRALADVSIMVIANAASPSDGSGRLSPFTNVEIEAVAGWVESGGSLLLVADHAPHGTAAERLAVRFGVTMGKGHAFDHADEDITPNLAFHGSHLGAHSIVSGRDGTEPVKWVQSFTGQSLQGPQGSTILLALNATAREAADQATLAEISRRIQAGELAADVLAQSSRPALPGQGVAFSFGKGRVVVLGDAAMLTAQILRFPQEPEAKPFRFGLTTDDGHDNQQLALNVIHWLSGVLP